jgi:hypothetical protein
LKDEILNGTPPISLVVGSRGRGNNASSDSSALARLRASSSRKCSKQ